jgi:hypothetical protein
MASLNSATGISTPHPPPLHPVIPRCFWLIIFFLLFIGRSSAATMYHCLMRNRLRVLTSMPSGRHRLRNRCCCIPSFSYNVTVFHELSCLLENNFFVPHFFIPASVLNSKKKIVWFAFISSEFFTVCLLQKSKLGWKYSVAVVTRKTWTKNVYAFFYIHYNRLPLIRIGSSYSGFTSLCLVSLSVIILNLYFKYFILLRNLTIHGR